MYDGVGHSFTDGGLNVVDLLQGGVQLGGETGRRRPGKPLVGGAAWELQSGIVFRRSYVKPPYWGAVSSQRRRAERTASILFDIGLKRDQLVQAGGLKHPSGLLRGVTTAMLPWSCRILRKVRSTTRCRSCR